MPLPEQPMYKTLLQCRLEVACIRRKYSKKYDHEMSPSLSCMHVHGTGMFAVASQSQIQLELLNL